MRFRLVAWQPWVQTSASGKHDATNWFWLKLHWIELSSVKVANGPLYQASSSFKLQVSARNPGSGMHQVVVPSAAVHAPMGLTMFRASHAVSHCHARSGAFYWSYLADLTYWHFSECSASWWVSQSPQICFTSSSDFTCCQLLHLVFQREVNG